MSATTADVEERIAALENLTLPQIRWLRACGVPPRAIVHPEMLARADVVFRTAPTYFDFASDLDEEAGTTGAVIIVARHQFGEPCDLVAWSPRTGQLATWAGSDLPMLGWNNVFPPRLDLGDALTVHPTPLEWLRDDREGVVILKPVRARHYLEGFSLKVKDAAFGRRVRDAMRGPEPLVFVETDRSAAA